MDMPIPHIDSYGSWKSPISSEMIVSKSRKFNNVDIDSDYVYYDEVRFYEGGRNVLIRNKHGKDEELLPENFNVRTKANEYGGKSFYLKDHDLFFVSYSDQRIYKVDREKKIEPITAESSNIRYADIVFDKKRDLIFCVQEDHKKNGEVINSIIKIDLSTRKVKVVASGHDFYSSLAVSPNKNKLSHMYWDHPSMPWDSSYLVESDISEEGELINSTVVAGGEDESVFQPSYSPDNLLFFVSDRTGFYNIYYLKEGVQPLFPSEADFGYPQWVFGMTSYCFVENNGSYNICTAFTKKGKDFLGKISLKDKVLHEISLPFTYFFNLKSYKDKVVFVAASPIEERCVVLLNSKTENFEVIKRGRESTIDKSFISIPENIEYPTREGKVAYALYYPPTNPNYVSKKDELPPLIVKSHGGPSGHFFEMLDLETQYFTSRGFAVVDVNYSGSTGFGRAYRNALKGKWGILDVFDCADAAIYLSNLKKVDKDRLVIKGSSAGGYTTLAALTFLNLFKAGVSYYGVGDLESLAINTHKFEAHYLDGLIGPYPERKDLYLQRSPINFINKISAPLLIFQGAEDKIVPKDQADRMYNLLNKRKIPVAYFLFENEGHGFRHAKNIKTAIEAELYFYSKIFQIKLSDELKPIKIDNL